MRLSSVCVSESVIDRTMYVWERVDTCTTRKGAAPCVVCVHIFLYRERVIVPPPQQRSSLSLTLDPAIVRLHAAPPFPLSMSKDLKKYTRKEVEEHNSAKSTWIVINNLVYDVTPFLDEHPGGIEVLLEHAGIDGTEDFEDVGHSTDAKEMRDQYLIGEIVDSEKQDHSASNTWASATSSDSNNQGNTLNFVLAAAFGIGGYLLYNYFM